jgi:NADH dehydrogenase
MRIERVCLIGGSGFVGRHITHQLAAGGIACRVLTRHPHRHQQLRTVPTVELRQVDIFDQPALHDALQDCDAVINLVGILNPSRATGFHRAHVTQVETLLAAIKGTDIKRLLHMSALHADEEQGASEYLRSKGMGENIAHTLGRAAGLTVTSFRPSVIFGSDDSFINRFAGLLRLPAPMPLACADARFAPVYVGDVAQAFVQALGDPQTHGRRYDLCGPEEWTLADIVDYIARNLNRPKRILRLPDWVSRLQATLLQFAPGKPFTPDNYRSLQVPSVCECNDLETLGITPTPMDAIVPGYLAPRSHKGPRGLL